ncbi:MAG: hypothetical protein K1W39_09575 [Lachnospiraceae bacterium]|nr:hypothetical protein [Lachnospiraceae bacterium]
MAYGKIKKGKIVVTMNMKDYEILNNASVRLKKYEEIFKRAKIDGTAVLTDELKEIIENPSSED